MEGSAISNSMSGISARQRSNFYDPNAIHIAAEKAAKMISDEYLHVYADAVVNGSSDGLLNYFKNGKGKALLRFREHTKQEYKDKCFPELPNNLADNIAIILLTDQHYHAEYASDVVAMSKNKRLVRSDEVIKQVYKSYCLNGHKAKVHYLDSVFGVDYSRRLEEIAK